MNDDEVTRTLKGIGPISLNTCPACHLKLEAVPIDADVAIAFGLAIVFVRGMDAARKALCHRHASLVDLLADGIGPTKAR